MAPGSVRVDADPGRAPGGTTAPRPPCGHGRRARQPLSQPPGAHALNRPWPDLSPARGARGAGRSRQPGPVPRPRTSVVHRLSAPDGRPDPGSSSIAGRPARPSATRDRDLSGGARRRQSPRLLGRHREPSGPAWATAAPLPGPGRRRGSRPGATAARLYGRLDRARAGHARWPVPCPSTSPRPSTRAFPGTTLAGPPAASCCGSCSACWARCASCAPRMAATITFHLPFIGAAMILGGPTAGAWVAFLSTIERRELESQPWYGILANHAVLAIAAVLGGIVASGVAMAVGGASGEVAGTPWDAGTLVAAGAGVVVLAAVATAMGATTVLLRDGLTTPAFLEALLGLLGRVTAARGRARALVPGARLRGGRLVGARPDRRVRAPDLGQPPDAARRRADRPPVRPDASPAAGAAGSAGCGGPGPRRDDAVHRPRRVRDQQQYGTDVGDEVLREVGTPAARPGAPARRHRRPARWRRVRRCSCPGFVDAHGDAPGRGDLDGHLRADHHERRRARRRRVDRRRGRWSPGAALQSGHRSCAHADEAMRIAKDQGGGVHLYDPTRAARRSRTRRREPERPPGLPPCDLLAVLADEVGSLGEALQAERRDVDARGLAVQDQLGHAETDGGRGLEPRAAVAAVEVEALGAGRPAGRGSGAGLA